MFCKNCGKELMNEAVICPNCGCAVNKAVVNEVISDEEDKVNIGLLLVSIIIPIVGVILWPVKHKKTPHAAMIYGLVGIVAWICYMLFILA